MKPLVNPYFIVSTLLYLVIYLTNLSGFSFPPIIRNYYADLLCLPVLLPLVLWTLQRMKRTPNLTLNKMMIIFAWLYVSVLFEFILPHFSHQYTADYWDIMMYGIGALVFHWNQQQLLLNSVSSHSNLVD